MKQAVFALLLLAACSGSSNRSALFIDNPAEGLSPSPAGIQPLGVTLDWLKTKTDSPRFTLTGNDFYLAPSGAQVAFLRNGGGKLQPYDPEWHKYGRADYYKAHVVFVGGYVGAGRLSYADFGYWLEDTSFSGGRLGGSIVRLYSDVKPFVAYDLANVMGHNAITAAGTNFEGVAMGVAIGSDPFRGHADSMYKKDLVGTAFLTVDVNADDPVLSVDFTSAGYYKFTYANQSSINSIMGIARVEGASGIGENFALSTCSTALQCERNANASSGNTDMWSAQAKLFGVAAQNNTWEVVGTFGYMQPHYNSRRGMMGAFGMRYKP